MKKFKEGDKVRVKEGHKDRCGTFRGEDLSYLIITKISNSYYYDGYTMFGDKINNCWGCYDDEDLVLFNEEEESVTTKKFSVGDLVKCILNDNGSSSCIGEEGIITSINGVNNYRGDIYPYVIDSIANDIAFSDRELELVEEDEPDFYGGSSEVEVGDGDSKELKDSEEVDPSEYPF